MQCNSLTGLPFTNLLTYKIASKLIFNLLNPANSHFLNYNARNWGGVISENVNVYKKPPNHPAVSTIHHHTLWWYFGELHVVTSSTMSLYLEHLWSGLGVKKTHARQSKRVLPYSVPASGTKRIDGALNTNAECMQKQVTHHDHIIKKLQDEVSSLKTELKESQSRLITTKNTLNVVKKELSVVQSLQFTWEDYHRLSNPVNKGISNSIADGKCASSTSNFSPKCKRTGLKLVPEKSGLPDSDLFSTDISCHEEVVCSNGSSPAPEADSTTTSVQMLSPIKQALVDSLVASMSSNGVGRSSPGHSSSICPSSDGRHAAISRSCGSNGDLGNMEISSKALVEAMPHVARPLCPLKPGITALPSSKIDKSSMMFTVGQVLSMYEGSNIAMVAGKLAELAVFGHSVLKRCTPCGQSSKRKLALPRNELMFIKQTILNHSPDLWDDLDHFEQVWNKRCMAYLSRVCSQARR